MIKKKIILLPLILLFFSASTQNTEYLSGKFLPQKDPRFQKVQPELSISSSLYLRNETLGAFTKMAAAARKDGVDLYVVSATRNFDAQKRIWEAKYLGKRIVAGKNLAKEVPSPLERSRIILRYSSMPGTSRHHWGSDLDIAFSKTNAGSALVNSSWETGKGEKAFLWLRANAARYGFCQPYQNSPKERRDGYSYGYEEEKWHWSYKPLSSILLKQYRDNISALTPGGFAGAEAGKKIFSDYVFNVHPECL